MSEGFQVQVPSLHTKKPMVVGGVLYGADSLVAAWIEDRLGGGVPLLPMVAFGVVQEGVPDGVVENLAEIRIMGGAYFYNHQNGPDFFDICATVAADEINVSRPDVIRRILEYPFGELRVPRITIEIHESNERALRQAEKLGCKIEGRKRKMGSGNKDIVMLGLLRDECPFWENKPRKRRAPRKRKATAES